MTTSRSSHRERLAADVLAGTRTSTNRRAAPGQYFDRETGLVYNINRDYDPSIGRYIESDPIGPTGGINSFRWLIDRPMEKRKIQKFPTGGGS